MQYIWYIIVIGMHMGIITHNDNQITQNIWDIASSLRVYLVKIAEHGAYFKWNGSPQKEYAK